ncbi:MAG TPA: hypothetical protein VMF68_08770 [Spirochaetia bacterium]|nr:hypothetical protein [Spirochaetia bacterium]
MAQPAERGQFGARRRKEQVAFLVVKFLRLYLGFREIATEFNAHSAAGTLASAGLFPKVAVLAQGLGFDLKELAHALFRNGQSQPAEGLKGREALDSMKNTLERRFLDSSIGTGFHLLLILQESLYQLERYSPELSMEKEEIERVMELSRADRAPAARAPARAPAARRPAAHPSPADPAEMDSLYALDEISARMSADAADLVQGVMKRCEDLLEATARVIRRFGTSANENEILVLNLLRNRALVEAVYGEGAAETILSELCSGKGLRGRTGVEKAIAFVKARCGNVSGLGPAAGASPGA